MQDFTKPNDPTPEATGGYEGLESNGVATVGATGRLETADLPRGSVSSAETSDASGNGASSAQAGRSSCALNPPPKKPSGSVKLGSIEDIKEWVWALLRKADKEADPEKRFELLQQAREYSRRVRWHDGFSNWWALAGAAAMCAMLVVAAQHQASRDRLFQKETGDTFRILKRVDAWHYEFQKIHKQQGAFDRDYRMRFAAVFCPNYEPPLSAGMTLTYLHYMDLGRCWNIEPAGYGYSFETTDGVNPKLAPNCFPNYSTGLYECTPNKLEAIWEDQ